MTRKKYGLLLQLYTIKTHLCKIPLNLKDCKVPVEPKTNKISLKKNWKKFHIVEHDE